MAKQSWLLVVAAVVISAICVVFSTTTSGPDNDDDGVCTRYNCDIFYENDTDKILTTNQGVPYADDANQLKAGPRGPVLLEDFIYREKMTHFDHERIPERAVHARGAAAHGYFEVLDDSMTKYTKAKFLTNPNKRTPVYVRFSTAVGSRGSADTARDVRGFAVKFYTDDGNFDLVANNIPVFFVQDSMKFPDLVHAIKPEPRNEIPQAQSAHANFYDFVGLQTEIAHMLMWLMSDRAIPRSYSMMQGFGVNTYLLVNAQGQPTYVKFHWRPILGVNSLVWPEAQQLMGKDPDFHRRQLWEDIENGDFPTFEFGVQLFTDADADQFDFDILDATKLVPEELIPVKIIGRLVLNRNPDNFFAETEQVAFCTDHLVPGIDVTNDPILQGRMFSYTDTQLTRLGGPNFHEIPINRPKKGLIANNRRDGFHRQTINVDDVSSHHPNSRKNGSPRELPGEEGGFVTYPDRVVGEKRRTRPSSFADHFSQATLFWNSMSNVERAHIIQALTFELSKVDSVEIRKRVVARVLKNIDATLATSVANNIGLKINHAAMPPSGSSSLDDVSNNNSGGGGGDLSNNFYGVSSDNKRKVTISPALSQLNPINRPQVKDLRTRKVAVLAEDGVDAAQLKRINDTLNAQNARVFVVSSKLGYLRPSSNNEADSVKVDVLLYSTPSVIFDAVVVPDGQESVAKLVKLGDAVHFVAEAYKHAKPIAAIGDGTQLLVTAGVLGKDQTAQEANNEGVAVGNSGGTVMENFIAAMRRHRAYNRKNADWVNA